MAHRRRIVGKTRSRVQNRTASSRRINDVTAGRGSNVSGDITRNIPNPVQALLWGRAAGRCEFTGCNRPLWKSEVTQETRNVAQKAHIRAFSAGGPRADRAQPRAKLHDLSNLILLCHACHVTIDHGDGPAKYTAAALADMKRRHEQRVEIATAVAPKHASHVVSYGTHIGEHQALPTFADASGALFPSRYPAQQALIELGTRTSPRRDRAAAFWEREREQLAYQFEQQVRIPLERGDIGHVSLFALAPQPLLIELGTLLGDITPVETYQRHREPAGWGWPGDRDTAEFRVDGPHGRGTRPALLLSLSATITPDRVTRVLGKDVVLWTVTVPEPHNDFVKTPATLGAFRRCLRPLLDQIKARHGHTTPLHIFPAMPVSLAVELGRVRMPKADSPWVLYDEQQALGGFVTAFTLHGVD